MRLHSLVALASLPLLFASGASSQENLIHGCITKKGTLKIVSDPANCSSRETPISWNQAGAAGPEGPQGPTLWVYDANGTGIGLFARTDGGGNLLAHLPSVRVGIWLTWIGGLPVLGQDSMCFQLPGCQGQAYYGGTSTRSATPPPYELRFRIIDGTERYFVGQPQILGSSTLTSFQSWVDPGGDCHEVSGEAHDAMPADEISLGDLGLSFPLPTPLYVAPAP